jgi:hypothetical protein
MPHLAARTAEGLREISGLLHDAWIDLDGSDYDAEARTVVVAFSQEAGAFKELPRQELVRRRGSLLREHPRRVRRIGPPSERCREGNR